MTWANRRGYMPASSKDAPPADSYEGNLAAALAAAPTAEAKAAIQAAIDAGAEPPEPVKVALPEGFTELGDSTIFCEFCQNGIKNNDVEKHLETASHQKAVAA